MNFKQFVEDFDSDTPAWADMVLAVGRGAFDQTRVLVFADWLEENGWPNHAALARTLIDARNHKMDREELRSMAQQVDNYQFMQMRRVGGGLQLSQGSHAIIVRRGNGNIVFTDPTSGADVEPGNMTPQHRQLLAFGVLKRLVFFFGRRHLGDETRARIRGRGYRRGY